MEVTNGAVWQAKGPLEALLKEPWPVKVAYGLAKLARKVRDQHQLLEEMRAKLIRQYGEPTEDGTSIAVKQGTEQWQAFAKDFNELLNDRIELDNVWKVTLPADSEIAVAPADLMLLEDFMEVA